MCDEANFQAGYGAVAGREVDAVGKNVPEKGFGPKDIVERL